jgi:GntR family transcriptional regulator
VTDGAGQPTAEPKYYRVKRHLLESIESMAPGSAVPTERDLAAALATSRTTVRQALTELVTEGRLRRRQGAGTFVAEPKLTWPLHLGSFTEQIAASGLTASSEVLGTKRFGATAELALALGVAVRDPIYRIDRLRLADGRPIAVESSWFSAHRFPGLTRLVRSGDSLHALLADRYGAVIHHGEESIETAPATPREAGPLRIDVGAPMLVIGRRNFDADDQPIELGRTWFRGDRVTLVAQLNSGNR